MAIPVLPASAPFTQAQRAWLNGFFAGVLSFEAQTSNGTAQSSAAVLPASANQAAGAAAPSALPGRPEDETFPWHDATLPLHERLQLAEGRPLAARLMAAMAQLDCGSCGYSCQAYAAAIAVGDERDLSKCTPGGRETSRALKQILAEANATRQAA